MNHSQFSFAELSNEQKQKFNEARNAGLATTHNERFAYLLGLQAISLLVREEMIELDSLVNGQTLFFATLLYLEAQERQGGLAMTETARVTLAIRRDMDRKFNESQK